MAKLEIMNDAGQTICTVVAPRAEEVVAAVPEEAAVVEPELIRKPKEEGEAEGEAATEGKQPEGKRPEGKRPEGKKE
jgi:hypothetical protein